MDHEKDPKLQFFFLFMFTHIRIMGYFMEGLKSAPQCKSPVQGLDIEEQLL